MFLRKLSRKAEHVPVELGADSPSAFPPGAGDFVTPRPCCRSRTEPACPQRDPAGTGDCPVQGVGVGLACVLIPSARIFLSSNLSTVLKSTRFVSQASLEKDQCTFDSLCTKLPKKQHFHEDKSHQIRVPGLCQGRRDGRPKLGSYSISCLFSPTGCPSPSH